MRKPLLLIGLAIFLIITLLMANSIFNKDALRPRLDNIHAANQTIMDLAKEAADNSASFELKTTATNIFIVTSSDNAQLGFNYQKRYGKTPQKPDKTQVDDAPENLISLRNQPTYDSSFIDGTKIRLAENIARIEAAISAARSAELKTILENMLKSHQIFLDQLVS